MKRKVKHIPIVIALIGLIGGAIACDLYAGFVLYKYEGYDLVKGYESLLFHLFISVIIWETVKFRWLLPLMAVLIFLTCYEINDQSQQLNNEIQGSDYINLAFAVPALFYLIHLYVKSKTRIYPKNENTISDSTRVLD